MEIQDISYRTESSSAREKTHKYGAFFHLLEDPFYFQILADFCSPAVTQPRANQILRELYRFLTIQAANHCLRRETKTIETRMKENHPEAEFEFEAVDRRQKVVIVDLMRAGILPTEVCFETLHSILPSSHLRQDHILMNRKTNSKGEVVGTNLSGHKIGGPLKHSVAIIPDPMGATGGSLDSVIQLYRDFLKEDGKPDLFISLHLIVTPEFLMRVKSLKTPVEVFALRVDRGLSPPDILKLIPGERVSEEKGLNEKHYIVPGGGGIGEVLNNSFV